MENAAIILTVSNYSGELSPLPGCTNDSAAIYNLVKATGKFDGNILHIADGHSSAVVKEQISDFVDSLKGKEIDELLFYYSGHGAFLSDEFRFLLGDFTRSKQNSTSLSNTELDSLARGLAPNLFIKIVDACQSGVNYIKGREEFEEYVKSNSQFSKIYFMLSSQQQQSSYQDSHISDFTESFLHSIYTHQSSKIRYTDIISSISDSFSGSTRQNPYFITQADCTEVFCEVNKAVKEAILPFLNSITTSMEGKSEPASSQTLVEAVKSASSTYCTKEVADQNYEKMPYFARQYKFSTEISSLFKITVIEHDGYPENPLGIGKWINELQAKNTYFAQPKKEWKTFQKRVLKNPLFAGINLSILGRNSDDDYKWIDDRKNEVVGYEITADLPYKHIEIHLEPNELSLAPESCYICPIVSRNKLAIFSGFCHFRYVGWDETKKASFSGWKASITEITDQSKINSSISEILAQFDEHVIRYLTQEFLPPDTDMAEDVQDSKSDKAPD